MIRILNYMMEVILGLYLLYGTNSTYELDERITQSRKKIYCWICGIVLILLSGLRSVRIGADTYEYYRSYMLVSRISWGELIDPLVRLLRNSEDIRDPGYALFTKITQIVVVNYQFYLLLIACLFMVPFIQMVIRESKDPIISFCLYSVLFYAFFSITGLRQTIATALVTMVGDKMVKDRKIVPFLLLTVIAATIHKSALVFFPFYFLSRIPIKRSVAFTSLILVGASFIFRNQLKMFFIDVSGYTDYVNAYEGGGTYTFTFLLFMLYILSFFAMSRDEAVDENRRFYIALYLAMFFTPLTWINPSAMRIVQYFSIYLVVLIPEMIDSVFTERSRIIARGIVILLLFILLIRGEPSYEFFWQYPVNG